MDEFRKPSGEKGTPGQNAPESQESGSATGIFGRETIRPHPGGEEDLLASLLRQSSAPPTPVSAPSAAPIQDAPATSPTSIFAAPVAAAPTQAPAGDARAAGPGEVTRILQRVKPSASKPDLAGVIKQVSLEKPGAPKPAEPTAGSVIPEPSGQPVSGGSPGSFTQAFRELSANSAAGKVTPAPVAPQSEPSGPGEFTKLFQSVQAPPQPSSYRPDPPYAPSAAPAAPVPSPPTSGTPESLTQLFAKSTPAAEAPGKPWTPAPNFEASFPATPPRREEALPAQGGFTQLFQSLNQGPATPPKPAELPPMATAPSSPAGGGFTQLLQSLSPQESQAAPAPLPTIPSAPPVASAPAAPPPSAAGPGEFTRVISASALRESQARTPAAPTPAVPAQAPAMRAPVPAGMPPMPVPPAMPMAQMPMAGGHAAPPQMPAGMSPQFSFPPAAAAPPAPAPAPAPSGLQKYLPLILMVNVFLMLAILLVLFFVLRHR